MVWFGQQSLKKDGLYYSGTVEAATISNLSFQVGGQVVKVLVTEGQRVEKDQPLAELDRAEFEAARDQARATLDRSERSQDQAAALSGVYRKTLPDDVARAEAGVASARDVLTEAQSNKERYDQLYSRQVVSKKEWETVKLNYDTARSKLAEAEAVLRQAKGNLGRIGATEREVEAARAQAAASKAALEQARIQLDRTQLRAPFAGIITSRNIEPGEVVTPTREVLTLSDLATVDLKIFVDETEIGKVKPGQKAEVQSTPPRQDLRGNGHVHLPRRGIHPQDHPDPEGAGQAGLPRQDLHPQPQPGAQVRDARRCLVTIRVPGYPGPGYRVEREEEETDGAAGKAIIEVEDVSCRFGQARPFTTSRWRSRRGRSSASSAPTGRGNPPCSGWWPR